MVLLLILVHVFRLIYTLCTSVYGTSIYITALSSTLELILLHPPWPTLDLFHGLGYRSFAVDKMRDSVLGQPSIFGHDKVGDQCKNGHGSHDNRRICRLAAETTSQESRLTVQIRSTDGEFVRRKQDRNNPSVPEYPNELKWLAQSSQVPPWFGEPLRRTKKTAEADQSVGCRAGDSGS